MIKLKEILRLKFEAQLSLRQIALCLSEHIQHMLVFSLSGQRGDSEANDGTVTVHSQLMGSIQDGASPVVGINEGHVSVLTSTRAFQKIARFLEYH